MSDTMTAMEALAQVENLIKCANCPDSFDNKALTVLRGAVEERDDLAELVCASQTWDGNDRDDDRWSAFYEKARELVAKEKP